MPIIAREPESKFTPAPEGLHHAVCVDVHDLGQQETPWGLKAKVVVVWQLGQENEETLRRFEVRRQYTLSLSEKANLRRDLECWRGKKFSHEELQGFDLEKLLGVNCQLQIVHTLTDDGRIFANVQAVVPYHSTLGLKLTPEKGYVRLKDRASVRGNGANVAAEDEDPIPFAWLMPIILPVVLSLSTIC